VVTIEAPRQQVWDALLDPASLRQIIPGCESIEATGPEAFHARVRVSIAGIGGLYDAHIRIFDRNAPNSLRLSGSGESKLGFGHGEAFVTLKETPSGATELAYQYGADVGGRVAAFGQRMLDGVVRVLLGSFFERLQGHLRGESPSRGLVTRLRAGVTMLRLMLGSK
jgi:2-furoyl-CoA dehydrogenase large subunit